MLNHLPAPIQLEVAILFTALAWGLGFYVVTRRVYVFASLATGCFVCLIGWTAGSVGAPAWVIIAAPLPFDILLLWYVLRNWRKMLLAYPAIWATYIVLHMLLSSVLRYDNLIPPWKLHA